MSPQAWDFLEKCLTLLVVPAVMWYLNQKQTVRITAGQEKLKQAVTKDAAERADEVKAELANAKIELKQESAVVAARIDAVHETAAETKKLANGDRSAKEQEIRRLRAKMRDNGLDPDESR